MSPRQGWPHLGGGSVVGLLGGSFDPPHAGHVHITMAAMRRFGLDRVLWLVSSGNPIKRHGPAPIAARMAAAKAIMHHPRVEISDLESRMGTRYTADTIAALNRHYPATRFVWLMGADNLAGLHRWDDWRALLRMVPVGVLARPGQSLASLNSPAARAFASSRLTGGAARCLARADPPAWAYVNIPLSHENSTDLRKDGRWPGNDVVTVPRAASG